MPRRPSPEVEVFFLAFEGCYGDGQQLVLGHEPSVRIESCRARRTPKSFVLEDGADLSEAVLDQFHGFIHRNQSGRWVIHEGWSRPGPQGLPQLVFLSREDAVSAIRAWADRQLQRSRVTLAALHALTATR